MDQFNFPPQNARRRSRSQSNNLTQQSFFTSVPALYLHAAASSVDKNHRERHSLQSSSNVLSISTTPSLSAAGKANEQQTAGSSSPGQGHRKRASMSRSRTGCWTCRLRRKKCPEEKPQCSACERLKLKCDGYGDRPEFMQSPNAMDQKRDKIRKSIRRFKKLSNHETSLDISEHETSLDSGFVSGMSFDTQTQTTPFSLNLPVEQFQLSEITSIPKYLDIEVITLDVSNPDSSLGLLSHYIHEIPPNICIPDRDLALQLFLLLVYFRYANRLLFPVLFLEHDDKTDFTLLLYRSLVYERITFRSICCIAVKYITTSGISIDYKDPLVIPEATRIFLDRANRYILSTSIIPERDIEAVMFLGWNTYTLTHILSCSPPDSILSTLLKVITRFSLLDSAERPPLLRILVSHCIYADMVSASTNSVLPILSGTYSSILVTYIRGGITFRTSYNTGFPICTYLILLFSRVVQFFSTVSSEEFLALERIIIAVSSFHPDADSTTFVYTASQIFQCALMVELHVNADEWIRRSAEIIIRDLLGRQLGEHDVPEVALKRSIFGQELERSIVFPLVILASSAPANLSVVDGVSCRDVFSRMFDKCVVLGSFGNWNTAIKVVNESWKSKRSWRDTIHEKIPGWIPI
ncbi:hypothetical protein V1514DRAFT_214263 [Lipomyces japonicus]|uniref:uncharacterized protein n=1 Tax=Lipomyces japonicus TaxID=56871 RepID=UPI0034CE7D50